MAAKETAADGRPTNPSLSVKSQEEVIRDRRRQRTEILADLLDTNWVTDGRLEGFHSLVLQFDSAVYEPAALPINRDYRVSRVHFEDKQMHIEILEWD